MVSHSWTHLWGGRLSWAPWVLSAPRTAPCGRVCPSFPKVGRAQPSGDWKEASGADLSPAFRTLNPTLAIMLTPVGTLAPRVELFPDSVTSPGHVEKRNQSLTSQESKQTQAPTWGLLHSAEETQSPPVLDKRQAVASRRPVGGVVL